MIRTAALTGRYPDVGVYCDEAGENQRWRERPCLLVEVVSADSSAGRDRVTKRGEYLAMPSVLAYLIVDPETRLIEVVQRVAPDSDWTRWLAGLDDTITLTCPPMTLNVSDVFA